VIGCEGELIAETMARSPSLLFKSFPKTFIRDSVRFLSWAEERREEGRKLGDASSFIQNLRVVHKKCIIVRLDWELEQEALVRTD